MPISSSSPARCGASSAPERERLKYAGVDAELIELSGPIAGSLDRAVEASAGRLFALPTYTALLELRTLLAALGLAKDYWR